MQKTQESRHTAWLVDVDGTLYRSQPVNIAMAFEMALFGWKAIPVIWRFRRQHELLRHEPTSSELGPYLLQLARTASACDAPLPYVRSVVEEWMIRRPAKWMYLFRRRSLLKEMRQFREKGGRIAIVSDYPAVRKLEALHITDLANTVIASGEESPPDRLKPSPDGYLKAATRLGITPRECLVIGDRADTDGVAATTAGMEFRKV